MKLDFFQPREKFLILEILPHGAANGLFLSVGEDRAVAFEKFVKNVELKKLAGSPGRRIAEKRWEGKNLFDSRRRLIAIADPAVATTIPVPVELDRGGNREQEKITVMELEESIEREMKRIFNSCRAEAAKRLDAGGDGNSPGAVPDELGTILVGAKLEHAAVDGKPVHDPAGHVGKKVSFLLELTFTTRDVFESLKEFFSAPQGFYFVESPQVHLRMLAAVRPLPVNLIAERRKQKVEKEEGGMHLFIFQKPGQKTAQKSPQGSYPVLYRETLDWDFDALFDEIAAAFAVSRAVAEGLYRAYAKGKMSETALRHFKKLVEPAAGRLLKEAERAKIAGWVSVDAPHALPFPLPYKHGHEHGTAAFDHLPTEELLQKFGFTMDVHAGAHRLNLPPSAVSRYLAPFFEAYYDKDNSEINRKLRRRLHWLAE